MQVYSWDIELAVWMLGTECGYSETQVLSTIEPSPSSLTEGFIPEQESPKRHHFSETLFESANFIVKISFH